jgi:hypothetical protein
MPWILSAAFLVVEALAVASAVHALFTVRTAQGTIAWVIGLITFLLCRSIGYSPPSSSM